MSQQEFDRWKIRFRSVSDRTNKFRIDDIAIDGESPVPDPGASGAEIDAVAAEIRRARSRGAPVVLVHGAHLIKNGLGPLVVEFVKDGWLTHVGTNGAGSIHDWEFAFLGSSCEDVAANVAVGEFGIWDETGGRIGLSLLAGGIVGAGYGEAVGRMISEEKLVVPDPVALRETMAAALDRRESMDIAAAAADLLSVLERTEFQAGAVEIPHPWKHTSVQCACYENSARFTVHPGIGQDIIYSHPLFQGGSVGRASMRDFLRYAATIRQLDGGVYLSVGSSVMSPMIFEKSLSMARNVLLQEGSATKLENFSIVVNDLAAATWDWSQGEPPVDNPAYYVRFCKTFSRMGGRLSYLGMDNRVFLQNLYARLSA